MDTQTTTTTPCYTREPLQAASYVPASVDPEVLAARAAFREANVAYRAARAHVETLKTTRDRRDPELVKAVQDRSSAQLAMRDALIALALVGKRKTDQLVRSFETDRALQALR